MSTPCQHLCIPLLVAWIYALVSVYRVSASASAVVLPADCVYSAVSLCLHFCRLLSGIVWLLTGLDTSHSIFSWSYNDWHNNMFQLTTYFAWWTDVGSSPWNIVQYLIHDGKQVFFNSFISGPSTNRLSISPICLKWQSKEYLLLTCSPWVSV